MGKRAATSAATTSNKKAKPDDANSHKDDAAAVATLGKAAQAPHLVKVHKALNTIRNCSAFDGIGSKPPLKISEGGTEAPLNTKDCKVELLGNTLSGFLELLNCCKISVFKLGGDS